MVQEKDTASGRTIHEDSPIKIVLKGEYNQIEEENNLMGKVESITPFAIRSEEDR